MSKSRFAKGIRRRQEKQEKDAQGGSGVFRGDVDFNKWKPGKGQHMIDIVPYFAGKNDYPEAKEDGTYMFSFGVHYNIGIDKKAYICPKTIPGLKDKRCPICEHAAKLKNEGKDYDDYKEFFPKKRELYNVVIQDSEKERDKGVQVFEVSYHYMGKLLEPIMKKPIRPGEENVDPYIDFALETKDGKTIAFSIGEKKVGKDVFPTYEGHRFVDRDYDLEDYLDDAYVLDELLYIPTYDEIYKEFWDSSEPEQEEEESKPATTLRERKNKNKKIKKETVEEPEESEDEPDTDESEDISEADNDFFNADTEKMNRKALKVFIKKHNVPLDDDLGDNLKDYDDEDLRFIIDEYIDNKR